jgi:hypothetical protein
MLARFGTGLVWNVRPHYSGCCSCARAPCFGAPWSVDGITSPSRSSVMKRSHGLDSFGTVCTHDMNTLSVCTTWVKCTLLQQLQNVLRESAGPLGLSSSPPLWRCPNRTTQNAVTNFIDRVVQIRIYSFLWESCVIIVFRITWHCNLPSAWWLQFTHSRLSICL